MEYEIWSEGYEATIDRSGAIYHGSSDGSDFEDACIRFAETHPEFDKYFNKEKLTCWGCRLFDNEIDARKYFG